MVCLTEETTEWLWALGEQRRIVGISAYTERPPEARGHAPVVSAFIGGSVEKIVRLKPDLVVGFSDVQAGLARELISAGLPVLVTNQRSVQEIFDVLAMIAGIVGAHTIGDALLDGYQRRLDAAGERAARRAHKPRVYFEEWDEPMISAIQWVSELITTAGGDDVFPERAVMSLGRDRVIADALEPARRAPDLSVGSWCGTKFRPQTVAAREGWAGVPAVREGRLHEIKSCDILQPGPAALTDGLEQLHRFFADWAADSVRR